ncbi:MAG: tetratricopeptide repeat protein [Saprospiraceae bacterium]|nr:tetratricopeptide repeat protein [Saprospiraceae bacterium]
MTKTWKQWGYEYEENEWAVSSAFAWEKAVAINPNANNLFHYACQLRICLHYTRSEEIFDRILVDEIPDEYKFCYFANKGRLFEDQGRLDEAISAYKKSIEVGTDCTYPYIFLGTCLMRKEMFLEAREYLIQALQKEGDVDEAYFFLSTISARLGDFEKAISAMQECLKLDANFPNAQAILNDFKNFEHVQGFQDESM